LSWWQWSDDDDDDNDDDIDRLFQSIVTVDDSEGSVELESTELHSDSVSPTSSVDSNTTLQHLICQCVTDYVFV